MKQGPIAITGMGAVCSLGIGIGPIGEALREGKRGIGQLRHSAVSATGVFGEVDLSGPQLVRELGLTDRATSCSRTFLLASMAAREALNNSGAAVPREVAFISASTVGGMDVSERNFTVWTTGAAPEQAALATLHPVGHHARQVARMLGLGGLVATISTACSSSANALMFGADLIRAGRATKVLAGGADALCGFTIAGFRALGAMDPEPSRPFTNTRNGLNLGEAAAYLMLEPLDDALREGRRPLAMLVGHANRNDAHHITATSPEGRGPYLAMSDALRHAGLSPHDVDHINAHGTGTANNDSTELTAIERLFPLVPPFCSTKALTGHTLGAAALEAVFSVLSIVHGFIPAGASAYVPLEGHRAMPNNACIQASVRTVLSNSFGFGGNDSSLVFTAAA